MYEYRKSINSSKYFFIQKKDKKKLLFNFFLRCRFVIKEHILDKLEKYIQ